MNRLNNPGAAEALCCCEYYNLQGERSHIMASCCECDALDEACDRLFKCERVPESAIDRLFDTISDRLRLPGLSGASKLRLDVAFPVLVVPISLYVATLHPYLTVLVFLSMPFCLQIFYLLWRRRRTSRSKDTPFFFAWGVSSVITSYVVFQVFLMIFREVLLWEIMLMFTMVATLFYLLSLVKKDPGLLNLPGGARPRVKTPQLYDQAGGESSDLLQDWDSTHPDLPSRAGYCRICEAYISVRDHHCVWINSCVGSANHRPFLLAMLLFVIAGAYGSHLALTTVCTPTMYMDWFLLPNDCRWLYVDFVTALCFVTAVYAILATSMVSIGLLFQFLLISQNATSHELALARRQGRTACGVWVKDNPNNKGFLRNWIEFWFLSVRTGSAKSVIP